MDVVAVYPNTKVDHFVVVTRGTMYQLDISGWVWLHLAIATAAVIAGLLVVVVTRRRAAFVGIAAATLAIIADVIIFPYAPILAALVIGANAGAIRLLLRHGRSRLPG